MPSKLARIGVVEKSAYRVHRDIMHVFFVVFVISDDMIVKTALPDVSAKFFVAESL